TAAIDTVASIDYSLVGPPVVTAQYLDVNLKGEVFSRAHRAPAPFSAPALALPTERGRMVYLGVSSYFFNTAGVVYQAAGLLVFNITNDMFPKEGFFHLNTSAFSHFIPQVSGLLPLRLTTPSAPFLTVAPRGLELALVMDIQAYASLPSASLAPLFLLPGPGSTHEAPQPCAAAGGAPLPPPQRVWSLGHPVLLPPTSGCHLLCFSDRLKKGFSLPLPKHVQLSGCSLQPRQVSDTGWGARTPSGLGGLRGSFPSPVEGESPLERTRCL
uniref:Bactericidal permeability-increasing protein n=1 Tax=Crocodylus porosus TaxID=8502 RepID=A0A7M4FVZ8_CROPO